MLVDGPRPVLVLHAVGHECQERLLAALLDQPLGERMALRIERHHVLRIFLHRKHLAERNAAAGLQELDQHPLLLGDFAAMLDRRAGAFVGPAGQRLAEIRRENRVRHFVRQHRIEHPLARALNLHLPVEHFAAIEHEARRAAGAQVRRNLGVDRAGLRPGRHLFAEPFDRELLAATFRPCRRFPWPARASGPRRRSSSCDIRPRRREKQDQPPARENTQRPRGPS